MPPILAAGLQSFSTDYILVTARKTWRSFRLLTIHQGSLSELITQAAQLPVAIAIQDESLPHWLEEFPSHLTRRTIVDYLRRSKAELLSTTQQHLTIVTTHTGQSQQVNCWLFNRTLFWQECQAYLEAGFHIQAVEPLSYLNQRSLPHYQDPQHLLAQLPPTTQPIAQQALKLACRTNWARHQCEEDWLC